MSRPSSRQSSRQSRLRRTLVSVLAAVATALPAVTLLPSPVAYADTDPVPASTPATVSSTALPTVQIDGVVWSQVMVGTTVYAVGDFDTARPAGAPAGQQTVPRSNALAYDIETGQLLPWSPSLNNPGLAIAASDDGQTLYIGGEFTQVNGWTRRRVAAVTADTGRTVGTFAADTDARVKAVAVRGDRVYIGGLFSQVKGATRARLAAVSTVDGALLPWAPSATGGVVNALAISSDGTKVAVGGAFTRLNSSSNPGYGLGAVDATTGALVTWRGNTTIRNAGTNAAITSLVTRGDHVYGSGYVFGSGGNVEGAFKLNWSDGSIAWLEDCHGDTYGVYPVGDVVYTASHAHSCATVPNGYPETSPRSHQFALAFTDATTGTLARNTLGNYANFQGQPAPTLLDWYPTFVQGSHTGLDQAGFSVVGNDDYVAYAGEFVSVNGTPQQGIVRFAAAGVGGAGTDGPRLSGAATVPTVSTSSGQPVVVGWGANWDRDNRHLTYTVVRDGVTIHTTSLDSRRWSLPRMSFTDLTAVPGQTYGYRIFATDADGNVSRSDTVRVTVPGGAATPGPYASAVAADSPTSYWRLANRTDAVGDTALTGGSPRVESGSPLTRDGTTASASFGSSGAVVGAPARRTTPASSVEAWFRTSSARGRLVGQTGDPTGTGTQVDDRVVRLVSGGALAFTAGSTTVTSGAGYADNAWHHVVGTAGPDGVVLYVDGSPVASSTTPSDAATSVATWGLGGTVANPASGPTATTSFVGSLDEVATYPSVLSAARVRAHHRAASGSPEASFEPVADGLTVRVDGGASTDPDGSIASYAWTFGDGGTATGATAQHAYAAAGTYQVGLTVTDDSGLTATTTREVTVTAPPSGVVARDGFTRSVTGGWGAAELGGAWTRTGAAQSFAVDGSVGTILLGAPGAGPKATLGVSAPSSDAAVTFSLDSAPTGGGTFVSLLGRTVGTADYRAKARLLANGSVTLQLVRQVGGTETTLASRTIAGLAAGSPLRVRLQTVGSTPTTLRASVWAAGGTQPADWQLTATDSTAGLQAPGGVGVTPYLTASATTSPVTVSFDDLDVLTPQG